MTRIAHIFKELFRNLYRNPGTVISSLLSLTLLFLLFDLFWVATGSSRLFYDNLLSDLEMELYVSEEFPDSMVTSLEFRVLQMEGVETIRYISRDSARSQLSELVGVDLLAGYDSTNPLPRSFLLTFEPQYLNSADMAAAETELKVLSGIDHVYYSRRWLEKAESTRAIILSSGMVLGILIILTALISSANNIRFMARSRGVGYHQMILLGAGKLFVALPTLADGFLLGGLSSAAGWLLIYYGRQKIAFTQFEIVLPTMEEIVLFCLAAAMLGVISGYLGIRKQLKQEA